MGGPLTAQGLSNGVSNDAAYSKTSKASTTTLHVPRASKSSAASSNVHQPTTNNLAHLLNSADPGALDLTKEDLMDILKKVLESNAPTKSNQTQLPATAQSPAQIALGAVRDGVSDLNHVKITCLGSAVINSMDEPIATPHPQACATAAGVSTVDGTSPQFKDHAQVWKNAIQAGRTGGPMVVNGEVLNEPAFLLADSQRQLVKVPLAAAVNASPTALHIASGIKPAIVRATVADHTEFQTLSTAAVELPPVLHTENLVGNESTTVPPGFTLVGTIKLFGGLQAERYSFQGSDADEKAEMVVVTQSPVDLDQLFPSSGVSFNKLRIAHPSITYINKPGLSNKEIGLWLEAGLQLDDSLADAGGVMTDIFNLTTPSIDISCYLGGYQSLTAAFKLPPDLVLSASLKGLTAKLGKFVELTSVNVMLHANKAAAANEYSWSSNFGGEALVTVPGSVAPVVATYTLTKAGTTYTLNLGLTGGTWKDAMGVSGFHLDDVKMTTSFSSDSKAKAFNIDIEAAFHLGQASVAVNGHYSDDGWDFSATVGDFNVQALQATYSKLFGTGLANLNHDVVFTGLKLSVTSKDKALQFQGSVAVDNLPTATASISLSTLGVVVNGELDSITFDKLVTINKANLNITITKEGLVDPAATKPGTSASFTITGQVTIKTVTIDAVVSFDKDPTAGLVWVVYAKATTDLTLSKFVEKLPSGLDLRLSNAAVMASNTDQGALFQGQDFGSYTVKKGFQLFAKIDCPHALQKTLHTSPGGMVLELDLGSVQESVDFLFAAPCPLVLKPGMVSPSVHAGIILSGNPQIFVEADLAVQLKGQAQPLIFALRLQAGLTEAQASASLMTDWANPFGISPKVKVLSPLTLDVIIDYEALTYPSGLALQGGVQIGETKLHAAMEIAQNPEDGCLVVEAEQLGIKDIISFASMVIEHDIPMPNSDFIYFKDFYLAISSGANIGPTYYPPGATFRADLLLFGKEIKVACMIDKSLPGFQMHAEMDTFTLGPLQVTGNTGQNPVFDLQCGTKLQELNIDGKIKLFDLDIAATVRVTMVPLDVFFEADLEFADDLIFKLEAHIAGPITSVKDIIKSDFDLSAEFDQKLLDKMVALATTYIAVAKKAVDEGIDSAKSKLDAVETTYNSLLDQRQRELSAAQLTWNKKNADTTAVIDKRRQDISDDLQKKRNDVDNAQKAYNDKITDLEHQLAEKKIQAQQAVKAAQDNLTAVRQKADTDVNNAAKNLSDAQHDMTNRFGDANNKIKAAQGQVDSAQGTVNSTQKQVDDCNHAMNNGAPWDRAAAAMKMAGYEVALRGAQAGLATARGVLSAAQSVLMSGAYQAALAAIGAANGALAAAKTSAEASVNAASGSLAGVQAAQNIAIASAQAALDAAQKSCNELQVWNVAKSALDAANTAAQASLAAADAMAVELSKCAEKVAFDAATTALAVARSATKELDAAQTVLSDVEKGAEGCLAVSQWAVSHAGSVFNVKQVELHASLNDAAGSKKPFLAHVKGTFAGKDIDVQAEFTPGQAETFVKNLVMQLMKDVKL